MCEGLWGASWLKPSEVTVPLRVGLSMLLRPWRLVCGLLLLPPWTAVWKAHLLPPALDTPSCSCPQPWTSSAAPSGLEALAQCTPWWRAWCRTSPPVSFSGEVTGTIQEEAMESHFISREF
ncbi:hypothetical protein VULLAG_LOCUS131 [Vulpes lagopus]